MVELITGQLPKDDGVKIRSDRPADIELKKLDIGKSATLQDLSIEFTFFTHAALFVYGNWTRDPVADYIVNEDPSCTAFWINFDSPIFSGLFFRGPGGKRTYREWNYRLMCCPTDKWPGLLSCLQQLCGINYADGRFHTTVIQKIPMVDYLALRKKNSLPSPLPVVDVNTVGIVGNDQNVYFEPANNPPLDKVKIRLGPPLPEMVERGRQMQKWLSMGDICRNGDIDSFGVIFGGNR